MNNKDSEFNNLIRLPHGVSDFKKLVEGNYKFIDKTLFIKDIIYDGGEVIVITRPRRFGKTLNLSMLYYFLKYQDEKEKNTNLFKDLEISQHKDFCQKHQNQYPVIFITLKDVKRDSYEQAYAKIAELISDLYSSHRYLLESNLLHPEQKTSFTSILQKEADESTLTSAIAKLSKYLKEKFKKEPIILIDEYDTPIQEAHLKGYYEKMIGLMRNILGEALKDSKVLSKGIITGITRVAQESLFSGVNNLEVYSLLREDYGQYFGFLEEEVIKLISDTKQKVSIDAIKKWYNGYLIGKHVLYNPWSIVSCIKNHGALKLYWLNTAGNSLIKKLLTNANPSIKQQIEELLQGNIIEQPISENLVFPEIETSEEALWSLLLYAGYLKVLSSELKGYRFVSKIAIPNKEVSFVYDKIVEYWFSTTLNLDSYDRFVQSLCDGDLNKFKQLLSDYIMKTGSYFDFNSNTPEQIFHIFILGLVVGLRDCYYIYSNRESGFRRFDIIFIPHNKYKKGIILELKVAEKTITLKNKAKEALKQIKDKQYLEEFKSHEIKCVLAIGLAFCGKQVELAHEEIAVWSQKNAHFLCASHI